jgi:hypothetical protein
MFRSNRLLVLVIVYFYVYIWICILLNWVLLTHYRHDFIFYRLFIGILMLFICMLPTNLELIIFFKHNWSWSRIEVGSCLLLWFTNYHLIKVFNIKFLVTTLFSLASWSLISIIKTYVSKFSWIFHRRVLRSRGHLWVWTFNIPNLLYILQYMTLHIKLHYFPIV